MDDWDERMARVSRIWELLIEVWGTRNTDWGWGVYYTLEQQYGSVPAPAEITPTLVREGLLNEFNDQLWVDWVEKKFAEYSASSPSPSA